MRGYGHKIVNILRNDSDFSGTKRAGNGRKFLFYEILKVHTLSL